MRTETLTKQNEFKSNPKTFRTCLGNLDRFEKSPIQANNKNLNRSHNTLSTTPKKRVPLAALISPSAQRREGQMAPYNSIEFDSLGQLPGTGGKSAILGSGLLKSASTLVVKQHKDTAEHSKPMQPSHKKQALNPN